jgi:hypothetical protein
LMGSSLLVIVVLVPEASALFADGGPDGGGGGGGLPDNSNVSPSLLAVTLARVVDVVAATLVLVAVLVDVLAVVLLFFRAFNRVHQSVPPTDDTFTLLPPLLFCSRISTVILYLASIS